MAYRPDVDGLRAVAILSVLVFHAVPTLAPGGFIGVDIFFVISGFVIANSILSECKAGTFSLAAFYGRRIRRLFPALIVVVAATWIGGWFLLFPPEYAALGRYMEASAAFAANFLTYTEVGYFDAPAAMKPLLHLWSLGVEEQFYLVFPAFIVLVVGRANLGAIAIAAMFLISIVLSIATSTTAPSFAFYLPFTRFWEFAAGAVLALWPLARLVSPRLQQIAPALGTALLLVAFAVVPQQKFPGWWALMPVLGACLVIASDPKTFVNRYALASRPMVFIGLISYPLYLWHWPMIVLGNAFMRGRHPFLTPIVAVSISFLLAWLTYRFVERPVRAGASNERRRFVTAACASCVVGLALLGFVTARDGMLARYPLAVRNVVNLNQKAGDDWIWPPPIGTATNDKGPLVLTWGDSHADHLLTGLRKLQDERSFRLAGFRWWDECQPIGTIPDAQRCPRPGPAAMTQIKALAPDIVILAGNWLQYKNRAESISETLKFLKEIGVPKIVLVGPVPWFIRPPRITLYDAFVRDALTPMPDRLWGLDDAHFGVESEVRDLAARFGAVYISPRAVLCNDQGCLARLDNSTKDVVQVDGNHFSAAGSRYFVSHIAPFLFNDTKLLLLR